MRKTALAAFTIAAFIVILYYGARKPNRRSAPSAVPPSTEMVQDARIMRMGMEEAHANLLKDKRIVLLDVRTLEEWAETHIPGTRVLPLDEPEVFGPRVEVIVPDKNATVYVYCRSGRRSGIAVEIMRKLGYVNVYNIGGIIDWKYETEPENPSGK